MNHSTGTAMLRVQNDIIRALGDNNVVLLVLIYLSAAFDTVNHKRLLNTLHAIGITGKALAWSTSYLQNRSQTITISGKQSRSQQLECGVPQGSVLGPILFNVYTACNHWHGPTAESIALDNDVVSGLLTEALFGTFCVRYRGTGYTLLLYSRHSTE